MNCQLEWLAPKWLQISAPASAASASSALSHRTAASIVTAIFFESLSYQNYDDELWPLRLWPLRLLVLLVPYVLRVQLRRLQYSSCHNKVRWQRTLSIRIPQKQRFPSIYSQIFSRSRCYGTNTIHTAHILMKSHQIIYHISSCHISIIISYHIISHIMPCHVMSYHTAYIQESPQWGGRNPRIIWSIYPRFRWFKQIREAVKWFQAKNDRHYFRWSETHSLRFLELPANLLGNLWTFFFEKSPPSGFHLDVVIKGETLTSSQGKVPNEQVPAECGHGPPVTVNGRLEPWANHPGLVNDHGLLVAEALPNYPKMSGWWVVGTFSCLEVLESYWENRLNVGSTLICKDLNR